jgi:DNA-binding PadR family transcriptional regulator
MAKGDYLSEYKQLALTAVIVLGENAYGTSIQKKMEELAACTRLVPLNAVYFTLDRLEELGFVRSWFGGATKERVGSSKKFFQVTPAGEKALRDSLAVAGNLLKELGQSVELLAPIRSHSTPLQRRAPMSEELILIAADCPKGHRRALKYTPARLRELLDAGTLMLYCAKCDSHFPPTKEMILNLRRQVQPK